MAPLHVFLYGTTSKDSSFGTMMNNLGLDDSNVSVIHSWTVLLLLVLLQLLTQREALEPRTNVKLWQDLQDKGALLAAETLIKTARSSVSLNISLNFSKA